MADTIRYVFSPDAKFGSATLQVSGKAIKKDGTLAFIHRTGRMTISELPNTIRTVLMEEEGKKVQ